MSRTTLFGILATALLIPFQSSRAAPVRSPFDLYELGPLDDPALLTFGRSPGDGQVLHQERVQGRTWLLLALPDGGRIPEVAGLSRPAYLGRVRDGERVVFVAAEDRALLRPESGRSVQITPSGSTVFITSDTPDRLAARADHSFRVVERTQPAPIPRSGGTRDRFRRMVERTLEGRSGTVRTAGEVTAVRDQVSPDSLEAYVRSLAELPGGGKRSRYFARPETENVSRLYIAQKLEQALGPGSVAAQAFEVTTQDTTVTVTNLIAELPSGGTAAGAFLVTAHYDAIGTRSDPVQICAEGLRPPGSDCNCAGTASEIRADDDCEWDWRTDPAPGANDNGSGIACLLEAARVLAAAQLPFEFDIVFVAFQAEELGLLGSAAFADSVVNDGREIFGVFNLDQIAFNTPRNQSDIVANETSEWFADYIQSTALTFVPELAVNKLVTNFTRSDHASFWSVGIDAIDLLEDIDILYPQYHTFQDTWENTFPTTRPNPEDQLELVGKLLVSTLARLAVHYEAPDLAIPAGEIEVSAFSGDLRTEAPVRITARAHNLGSSSLTFNDVTIDTLDARVTFYDGAPNAQGALLGELQHRGFYAAGGVVPFELSWTPTAGQEGHHEIYAVVEGLDPGYEFEEVSRANNVAKLEVFLEGPSGSGPRLLEQYPFPNPVRGSVDDLRLYYELTRDATVSIQVFDMEAQLVGLYSATALFVDEGNRAGSNEIRGDQFSWTSSKGLESGVYFYTIRVGSLEGGSSTDQAKGKFALVR